jgi:hypothetical protein
MASPDFIRGGNRQFWLLPNHARHLFQHGLLQFLVGHCDGLRPVRFAILHQADNRLKTSHRGNPALFHGTFVVANPRGYEALRTAE